MFHLALVEPEIPPNTGNVARLCAATGTALHLVHPLGFSTDDTRLKRAGLDYWHLLTRFEYDNLDEFLARTPTDRHWYFTTKADRWYTDVTFTPGDFLVFGRETRGLPPELLAQRPDRCLRLPIRADARSLNLSNTVAVALYEALRQGGFPNLV